MEAQEFAKEYFNRLFEERDENFGNARDVRNAFENVVSVHADRVAGMENAGRYELVTVFREDVEKASKM